MNSFSDVAPIEQAAKDFAQRDNPIDVVTRAVINELKAKLPQDVTYISTFPDKGKDFDMEGRDAAILLIYGGSSYDGGGQFAFPLRKFRLEVMILARSLNSIEGQPNISITSLIELIRLTLDGGSFGGAKNFKVKSDELVGETETVFTAIVHFEATMPSIGLARTL
jgi:hypothetical protein